jgi:hypothetical protein
VLRASDQARRGPPARVGKWSRRGRAGAARDRANAAAISARGGQRPPRARSACLRADTAQGSHRRSRRLRTRARAAPWASNSQQDPRRGSARSHLINRRERPEAREETGSVLCTLRISDRRFRARSRFMRCAQPRPRSSSWIRRSSSAATRGFGSSFIVPSCCSYSKRAPRRRRRARSARSRFVSSSPSAVMSFGSS